MVIYLDVLILINLYVTYFQILAVSVFTHRKTVSVSYTHLTLPTNREVEI